MSKNGFWEDISNSKFFTIIFVLFALLLGITALTTFNGTLLTIGAALILSFVMPLLIYFRIWPKYKTIARVVFSFCFLVMNDIIISYFLQQGTSYPTYFLALIEYFVAIVLVMSVAALLYERYLRPKLESIRVKKVENHSLRTFKVYFFFLGAFYFPVISADCAKLIINGNRSANGVLCKTGGITGGLSRVRCTTNHQ